MTATSRKADRILSAFQDLGFRERPKSFSDARVGGQRLATGHQVPTDHVDRLEGILNEYHRSKNGNTDSLRCALHELRAAHLGLEESGKKVQFESEEQRERLQQMLESIKEVPLPVSLPRR